MAHRRAVMLPPHAPGRWLRPAAVSVLCGGLLLKGAQAQMVLPRNALAEDPTNPVVESPRFGATRFTPSIDARVVFTNNPGPDDVTGQTHRDTVLELQPSFVFERRGSLATINGNFAVSAIDYLNNSHSARLLPRGRINLASQPVEGLLHFDAFARVDPSAQEPFVARLSDETYYRLEPRIQYSVSPYLLRRFDDVSTLLVRSDYTNTRITETLRSSNKFNATTWENTVSLTRRPTPFGYELEGRTRDESDDRTGPQVMQEKTARLWVDYAFDPQVIVGVAGGKERVSILNSDVSDTVVGVRFQLRPTERTNLQVTLEDRYFGKGWNASIEHRTPFFSLSLMSARTVTGQDLPQFSFAAGSNIRSSIDQLLKTRIGDAQRPAIVDQIIADRNLPEFADSALTLYSVVPQLRENVSLNLALYGRRNLVYVQYGTLKVEGLPFDLPVVSEDLLQRTATIGWNTRLSPYLTLNTTLESLRVERLSGVLRGDYEEQRTVRGELVLDVSAKGSVTVGARRLAFHTNSAQPTQTGSEKAIYAGIRRRF